MLNINLTDIAIVLTILHATYFILSMFFSKNNTISSILLGLITQFTMYISIYGGVSPIAFIGIYLASIHIKFVRLDFLNSFEGKTIFTSIYGRGKH